MANTSQSLTDARINKKDEFYTTYEDISLEMPYYKEYFKSKSILLPCDDPTISNFYQYFKNNFSELKLKELVAVHYAEETYSRVYNGAEEKDIKLNGNGDFRNEETLNLIKKCDIVVTNPPFSLFTEFIDILEQHNKKYLILGNINSITCKNIWELVRYNKLWLGKTIHSGGRKFYVPNDYPLDAFTCGIDTNGRKFIKVKGVRWFTNIEYADMYHDLELTETFSEDKYPQYDNCSGIVEISKTKEIPKDYNGLMGVPITFIDKYNPRQFKILGMDKDLIKSRFILNGKKLYARIVIQRLQNQ